MKKTKQISDELLAECFLDGKVPYNSQEWVELINTFLSRVHKKPELFGDLLNRAESISCYKALEFLSSEVHDSVIDRYWDELTSFVDNIDPVVRYRGVWLLKNFGQDTKDFERLVCALLDSSDFVCGTSMEWFFSEKTTIKMLKNLQIKREEIKAAFQKLETINNYTYDDLYQQIAINDEINKYVILKIAMAQDSSIRSLEKLVKNSNSLKLFNFFYFDYYPKAMEMSS